MLTIRTFRNASFRDDPRCRDVVAGLAHPKSGDSLLDRVDQCDTLYLGLSAAGETRCAFMTAHEEVRTPSGDWWATVFLGRSMVSEGLENQGLVRHLYRRAVEEAIAWERQHGMELLLWGTTPAPTVFLGLTHFLPETQPRRDGSFDREGAVLAKTLRARLRADMPAPGDPPFALKNLEYQNLDSHFVADRIDTACHRKPFAPFAALGVDERRQDRLLFVSRTRNSPVGLKGRRASDWPMPSVPNAWPAGWPNPDAR